MENKNGNIDQILESYLNNRNERKVTIEKIFNLKNEISYFSSDNLKISLGPIVQSSNFSFNIECDIAANFEKLTELFDYLLDIQQNINEYILILSGLDDNELNFNKLELLRIVNQIENQSKIEYLCFEKIMHMDTNKLDNDKMVTILSCFKYPPYLNISDIKLFLDSIK